MLVFGSCVLVIMSWYLDDVFGLCNRVFGICICYFETCIWKTYLESGVVKLGDVFGICNGVFGIWDGVLPSILLYLVALELDKLTS